MALVGFGSCLSGGGEAAHDSEVRPGSRGANHLPYMEGPGGGGGGARLTAIEAENVSGRTLLEMSSLNEFHDLSVAKGSYKAMGYSMGCSQAQSLRQCPGVCFRAIMFLWVDMANYNVALGRKVSASVKPSGDVA
ncbi:hypothetical protein B0H17DRAFT_1138268 [Mycena rosella]|uniref:Uncharacterized protein n=1 Tax=Mycena rosella TaxID=1033263 RepID=A0AAD7GCF5_MYCRO|nr:hypothetical protein B0H17DRAFT_1138268 [Mycena rosella]